MISYSHELHILGNVGEGVGWKRNQHIYTFHHSTLSSLFISPYPYYFLRILLFVYFLLFCIDVGRINHVRRTLNCMTYTLWDHIPYQRGPLRKRINGGSWKQMIRQRILVSNLNFSPPISLT